MTATETRTLVAHRDPAQRPLGHLASHPVLGASLYELEEA